MKKIFITIVLLTFIASCNKDHGDSDSETTDQSTAALSSNQTGTTSSNTTSAGTTTTDRTNTGTTTTSGGTSTTTTTAATNEAQTQEFMDLVNDHRMSIGLSPLINAEEMSTIAQVHSDNMASKAVAFGHDGFSARCAEARQVMGGGNYCGENVAYGQKTPLAVFTAWMNSSGHRANIENPRYTHSGFGLKKSASGAWYWTHLFLEVK